MDLTGEYRIGAPREAVWAALNNPEVLRASIAGCDELTRVSDTEFTARVTAKIGPVKASFGGKITLSDIDPPRGYTITGEGQGGAAGFAKGSAKVQLESQEEGRATLLKYAVIAQIGGKLAQIGSRLVEGSAKKMADEFFAAFTEQVHATMTAPTAIPAGAILTDTIPGSAGAAEQTSSDHAPLDRALDRLTPDDLQAAAEAAAAPMPSDLPAAEGRSSELSKPLIILGSIVVALIVVILALSYF
ncbi:carbon monoxide dehydrogenase subunit G [Dongia soli]|uniref:Carbon monoxide dehydrogenase subunit G n=1 Tax=Dongia soli TaxID=600628 RepID=A0ABU5E870_9PROT|nr:carbon monoxide dehydrogenase subunit G [Dongia soli]MDY0882508.1 carbon monoxide dehydrogenase subunit G [Dongia soli]